MSPFPLKTRTYANCTETSRRPSCLLHCHIYFSQEETHKAGNPTSGLQTLPVKGQTAKAVWALPFPLTLYKPLQTETMLSSLLTGVGKGLQICTASSSCF